MKSLVRCQRIGDVYIVQLLSGHSGGGEGVASKLFLPLKACLGVLLEVGPESCLGPPGEPFYPFLGEGSTKIDYRKKVGTLILITSLLEDSTALVAQVCVWCFSSPSWTTYVFFFFFFFFFFSCFFLVFSSFFLVLLLFVVSFRP